MYHYQNVCGTRTTIKAHKTYAHAHTRLHAIKVRSISWAGGERATRTKKIDKKLTLQQHIHTYTQATKCFYTFWGFICLHIVHSWFIFSDQYILEDGAMFVCTVNGYVPLDEVRCRCVMCRTHIHLIFALFIFSTHARPLLNASPQTRMRVRFECWVNVSACVWSVAAKRKITLNAFDRKRNPERYVHKTNQWTNNTKK